jgi:hypothetical protein
MHDPVRDAAQWNDGARKKWRRFRQSAETRRDPAAVLLRELLGVRKRAAGRHGENGFAIARMDAQRVAPRAAVSAQTYRIDLRSMFDEKARRFGGASVKEGAGGHVS